MGAAPSTATPVGTPITRDVAPRGSFVRTHSNLRVVAPTVYPPSQPTTASSWYLCCGDESSIANKNQQSTIPEQSSGRGGIFSCCTGLCASNPIDEVDELLVQAEDLLIRGMIAYRTGDLLSSINLLTEGLVKRRDEVRKFESAVEELRIRAMGPQQGSGENSRVATADLSRPSSPTLSILPSQPSHSGMLDGSLNVPRAESLRHLNSSRNPFVAPTRDSTPSPVDPALLPPTASGIFSPPRDTSDTTRALVMGWQRPEDNHLLQLSLAMSTVVSSRYSDAAVTFLLELGFIFLQCGYRDAAIMYFSEVKEMASQAVGKCLLAAMSMESAAPGSFSESLLKKTAIIKYTEACLGLALTHLCYHNRVKKRRLRDDKRKQWDEVRHMVQMIKKSHQQRYRRGCTAICTSLNLSPQELNANSSPLPKSVVEYTKRKRALRAELRGSFLQKQAEIKSSVKKSKSAASNGDEHGVHKFDLAAIGPAVRMMYEQRVASPIATDRVESSQTPIPGMRRTVSILVPNSPKRLQVDTPDDVLPSVYSVLFDVPAVLMKSRKVEETLARKREEKRLLKARLRAFERGANSRRNRAAETVLQSAPPTSIMKRRRQSLSSRRSHATPQPTSPATRTFSAPITVVAVSENSPYIDSPIVGQKFHLPSISQSASQSAAPSGRTTRANSLQVQTINVPMRRTSIVPASMMDVSATATSPVASGLSPIAHRAATPEDYFPTDSLNRKNTLAPTGFTTQAISPAHADLHPVRENSFQVSFPTFNDELLALPRGASPGPRSPARSPGQASLPCTATEVDDCSSASTIGSEERHEDDELREMAEEFEVAAQDGPDERRDFMPKRIIGEVELPPEECAYTSGSTSCGSSVADEIEDRKSSPKSRPTGRRGKRLRRAHQRSSYSKGDAPSTSILRTASSLGATPSQDGYDSGDALSVSDFCGSSDEADMAVEGGESRVRASVVAMDGTTLPLPASSPAMPMGIGSNGGSSSESDSSTSDEENSDGTVLAREVRISVAKCISAKVQKRCRKVADSVKRSEFDSTSQAFRELGEAIQIVATTEHSRSLLLLPLFHLQGQLLMLTSEFRAATRTFQRCIGIVRSYADYRNSPGSDADILVASTITLLNLAKEKFAATKDELPLRSKNLPSEGDDGGAAMSLGGPTAASWKKSLPHLLGVGSGTVLESAARLHVKQRMRGLSSSSLGKQSAQSKPERVQSGRVRGEARVRIHSPAPASAPSEKSNPDSYNEERRISDIVDKFLQSAALADPDFGTFEQTVRTSTINLGSSVNASPAAASSPNTHIRGSDVLFPARPKGAKPSTNDMRRPTTLNMSVKSHPKGDTSVTTQPSFNASSLSSTA